MKRGRILVSVILAVIMVMSSATMAFAAAPKKEKVKYEGKGRVEVDFRGKVQYKKAKVTVKDTSGKKYTAKIVDKDKDDLEFRINKYKEGKTYKFTISGVKKAGTSGYGKVTGSVKIPAKKVVSSISVDKAKSVAINDAVSRYSIVKNSISGMQCEKDGSVYELEFYGKKSDGSLYELDYEIYVKGGGIKDRDIEREY